MELFISYIILQLAVTTAYGQTGNAVTRRYWDCCRPACSSMGACARDGRNAVGANVESVCTGGSAYSCTGQQPFVVNNIAHGWATASIQGASCCSCYELTFTSAPLVGNKMIVQVNGVGGPTSPQQFDILIPGDVRPASFGIELVNGCRSQWGQSFSVSTVKECDQLPLVFRPGCKFRFGWFKNANNPNVRYRPVACPSQITGRSKCASR